MNAEQRRWERAESLFHAALERPDGDRAEFLASQCAGDEGLRAEIQALLTAHDTPSPGFDEPVYPVAPAAPLVLEPGRAVGRYRIVRVIGAGGMGTVYEAAQDTPARTVALKVLSGAALSADAVRRFEQEAAVLGRLRHPGIARIYDAGVLHAQAPDGREQRLPFIAMELVPEARPLLRYTQEKCLDARARLMLFVQVCEAVQHAHAKGVIHRDLKPANILVDAAGCPQVIDFGVARATDADVARTTRDTHVGQIIGTVAYMSPEQCAGDPGEIDTRSDVYALGVVLFELLAGRPPYNVDGKLLHEAVRIIREDEPARLGAVNRAYRGDLETIAGKALAKDKDRRYQTSSDLAADLRRHLNNEPVVARPPSAAYQLAKFTRRHTALVGAAGVSLAVLLAALAVTSALYYRAEAARRLASEQQLAAQAAQRLEAGARADAEKARDAAKLDAAKAAAAVDFLVTMLTSADPTRTQGEKLTVRQVLDAAAESAVKKLADKPEVLATIERAMARTYAAIGNLRKAADHYARHAEVLTHNLEGQASVGAAHSRQQRGFVLWQLGDLAEARTEIQRAIDALDTARPEHARTLCLALQRLARLDYTAGKLDEALAPLQKAVQIGEANLPQTRDELAQAVEMLAATLLEQGKTQEALPLFRRSVELTAETHGPDHVYTAGSKANAAKAEMAAGNFDQADALLAESMAVIVKISGPDHRNAHAMKALIGELRYRQDRLEDSEQALTEGLRGLRAFHGRPAPDVFDTACKLGETQRKRGKTAEAISTFREAVDVGAQCLESHNPSVIDARLTLAGLLAGRGAAGDAAEAQALLDVVAAALGPKANEPGRDSLRLKSGRARCLELAGDRNGAEGLYRSIWEVYEPAMLWSEPDRSLFLTDLAEFLDRAGRGEEAAEWRAKRK